MGFARNVSLTFLAQITCQVLTIATGMLLVHWMDKEIKGPFDWLLQAPPLLMALGNLGYATAITYLGGARIFSIERLGRFGLALGLIVGLTLAACAAPFLMAHRVGGVSSWLVIAALSIVPAMLIRSYLNTTLLVSDRIARYNLVDIALPAGFLVFFLGAVAILQPLQSEGLVTIGVLARVGAAMLSLALVLVFVARIYPLRPHLDRQVLREGWRQARWAYGVSSVTELNGRFGFVVLYPALLYLHSPGGEASGTYVAAGLGLFGVALTFSEMLRNLPLAVEPILFRQVAGSREQARRITPQVCRNLFALSLVCAAGIGLIAPLVIAWLNADYNPALPALWALLPGMAMLSVAKTMHADLMGRGRIDLVFWNTLLSFVVMTGLNILLVPWLGVFGMGLAMACAYLVQAAGALFLYHLVVGGPILAAMIIQPGDIALYREILSRLRSRRAGDREEER